MLVFYVFFVLQYYEKSCSRFDFVGKFFLEGVVEVIVFTVKKLYDRRNATEIAIRRNQPILNVLQFKQLCSSLGSWSNTSPREGLHKIISKCFGWLLICQIITLSRPESCKQCRKAIRWQIEEAGAPELLVALKPESRTPTSRVVSLQGHSGATTVGVIIIYIF